jgi:L-phenylalanine/L-methionine N-acetyltransferase
LIDRIFTAKTQSSLRFLLCAFRIFAVKTFLMTIKIRRTEPDDYEAIRQVYGASRATWGTLQIPFPSAEQWRKRLADPPPGLFSLVACVENDEIVGEASLRTFPNAPRRRHVGGIGMAVRDDWQGKGVGTALMQAIVDLADNWLNLTRLELEVYTDNAPAIRLYEKFDFQIEGTRVDFAFREGQYVDAYCMARLRRG